MTNKTTRAAWRHFGDARARVLGMYLTEIGSFMYRIKGEGMIRQTYGSLLGAFVLLAGLLGWAGNPMAGMQEMEILDGEVWQQLSPDSKLAFVWGVAHVIEFERHLAEEQWGQDTKSFVPHFVKGLKGKTLNEVVIGVDRYYQVSPDRLGDPVMKAIVHTIVLPAL